MRMAASATRAQAHMSAIAQHKPARLGVFLRAVAEELLHAKAAIVARAHLETALEVEPRLATSEFGRMLLQFEQAAQACDGEQRCIDAALHGDRTMAREHSWRLPRSDEQANVHSVAEPLDRPVLCIGPNNFPLAYHGAVGGDAVAALATGHAIIAKGHPLHPGTGVLLAEAVHRAVVRTGMPPGCFQYMAHAAPADLAELMHAPVGAVAFTGSKRAGLAIKATCDAVGVPVFLEMSSVNPVWLIAHDAATIDECADAWMNSITQGAGQFCTKPGLLFVPGRHERERIVARLTPRLEALPDAALLSAQGANEYRAGIERAVQAGATVHTTAASSSSGRCVVRPTLASATIADALAHPDMLQEVFGPFGLVIERGAVPADAVYRTIGGQLTSCVWGGPGNPHHELTHAMAHARTHCGRMLVNKMPTGVTVTESMVHGGPFPSTGCALFTAVGFPTSMRRFAARRCYDGVPAELRPPLLR